MVVLFIGRSGSGKDTQAQMLAEKYGFTVTSTGDVFREIAGSDDKSSLELKAYIDKGEWVPDELVYKLLEGYLKKKGIDRLILTGAVRTLPQVALLDQMLQRLGEKLDRSYTLS
jgi:adenylate kinase